MNWRRLLDPLLLRTGIGLLPVRVRHGIAAGARWTLYPWSAYWRGGFEPEVQEAIRGVGSLTGRCAWDIGAHFGIYSVGLARLVGPAGQVAAFEPNPFNFRRLVRHARMNRLGWLLAFPCAVSDVDGTARLLGPGAAGGTTGHLPYDDEASSAGAESIEVPTIQLDSLVESGRLRPPWLVKVDAEGHGHRALRGMRRTLALHRPRLIVAFHSDVEVAGTLEILEPLGYRRDPVGAVPTPGARLVGRDWIFTPPA